MDVELAAPLLLRVVVGGTMVAHGLNHWLGGGRIAGTARWFGGLGLRYGKLQAWLSVVTEVGAGTLLVLGLLTPLACAAVISVLATAGLLAACWRPAPPPAAAQPVPPAAAEPAAEAS